MARLGLDCGSEHCAMAEQNARRRRSSAPASRSRLGTLGLALLVSLGIAGVAAALYLGFRPSGARTPGAGSVAPAASDANAPGPARAAAAMPARPSIPGWTVKRSEERARVPLRGYGPLGGAFDLYATASGRQASCLRLQAEDEARAAVVLAKYRSDLRALGGVQEGTIRAGEVTAPVARVANQGLILAARAGPQVLVLAAEEETDLAKLAGAALRGLGPAPDFAGAERVPDFLDSWDRHGFRFYYRPWETPQDRPWKDYDVLKEFAFARKHGTGLVFWATPCEIDTAAGQSNRAWWTFGLSAISRRGLPWVLNTSNSIPTWILNRHPEDIVQPMPQFSGGSHQVAAAWCAASRMLSWSSAAAKDEQLAALQRIAREYVGHPGLLEYLEPHGELCHGPHDVFLEYGPLADKTFREFLKLRHKTVEAVAARWGLPLKDWADVHVPEVASFLGWSDRAVDLQGLWRIQYEPDPPKDAPKPRPEAKKPVLAPAEWFKDSCDDASWPQIAAPGNDLFMHLLRKPAVMRRAFEVAGEWLAAGPKAWLYLWDLNVGAHRADVVAAHLNGQQVGEDLTLHATPHWAAFEVTEALKPGRNALALRLPEGLLGYRVYLSHEPPLQYPALGPEKNARWVDFADWRTWTRIECVRRGMEMLREVDPDRSFVCMAPDAYFAPIKRLCEEYGGHFHNTGHMGAFWNDYLPMLMRGSDLPFSLEPGGAAKTLSEFKHMMGLYFTEGIQAVHYFIHIGDVFWPDDIRAHFELIQPLVRTLGKVHPPKAEVAFLLSDRVNEVTGYPWIKDFNVKLPSGYWGWRFSDNLANVYHVDAVTDLDLEAGNAGSYRVIVDTNTTVMDEDLVGRVEVYVRKGGIFVTLVQTGRHTPERPDSWPIARLTGYKVLSVDPHRPNGDEARIRKFGVCEGAPFFRAADWPRDKVFHSNGLSLAKVAPECHDLLQWEDGTIAAGLRPLGKGTIVHLGLKFGTGRGAGDGSMLKMLDSILAWAKVSRLPASADRVMRRHYVSNNGLWDVWTLWNQNRDKPAATALRFTDALRPASCLDLLSGKEEKTEAGADGVELKDIRIEPLETRIYFTARNQVVTAPLAWFDLQRNWWRGTQPPSRKLPEFKYDDVLLDLTDGWAYRILAEDGRDDAALLADPKLNDAGWPRRRLDCWAVPEELPSRRIFFRRAFTVPAAWGKGTTCLWLRSWFYWTVAGKARYWLDGKEVTRGDGRDGLIWDRDLAPGSAHLLAVEIRGEGTVCGLRGDTWLAFTPYPAERLDLAGEWIATRDLLRDGPAVRLPGPFDGLRAVRRTVTVPAAWDGKQVWIHVEGSGGVNDFLVNGRYARRHHHGLGTITNLNLTAWVRCGEENRIEFLTPGGKAEITKVELWRCE